MFEENSNLSDADLERKMDEWHPKIYAELRLPRDVYVDDIEGLSAGEVTWLERQLRRWCKGILCVQDSVDLAFYLDEGIDTDYNYILFDIPHWRITGRQLARLRKAIPRVGASRVRNVEDRIDVDELFLRSLTKFYTNPDAQQIPTTRLETCRTAALPRFACRRKGYNCGPTFYYANFWPNPAQGTRATLPNRALGFKKH